MERWTVGDPDEAVEPTTPPPRPRASRVAWMLFALVLLGGLGAAGWLLLQLREARAQLDVQRVELEGRVSRAERERNDLLAARKELAENVQARDEELARLRGDFGDLEEKMKAEIEKGNVRLTQEKGRIKVDMVDEILFDLGEASISKAGEDVLSRVGGALARMKDKHIQVSGHTDDLPISVRLKDRFPTNWELSAARAITVVRFLEERAGIPGRRLVAAAHSQYDPVAPNKGSSRARNRRIEILLTPEIDPERTAIAAAPKAAPAAKPAAGAKPAPAAGAKPKATKKPAAPPARPPATKTAARR